MNKVYNPIYRRNAKILLIIGFIALSYLIFLFITYLQGGPTMRDAALIGISFLITISLLFFIIPGISLLIKSSKIKKEIKPKIFCAKCGNELFFGDQFCTNCGKKVDTRRYNFMDSNK